MEIGAIVLDSDNSEKLGEFYCKLLKRTMSVEVLDGEKWVIVRDDSGKYVPLVFQEDADYVHPVWPAKNGFQQQMLHLDIYTGFDTFEDDVRHALSCGATLSEEQFSDNWKVFLDPAGHPFCIIPLPPISAVDNG